MKRKMLAMLLACAMIVPTSAFSVMAEETEAAEETTDEVSELNWSDVEAQVEEAGWEGDFYAVDETGLMMWIPSALSVMDITEEDAEAGYILYLATEDESSIVLVQDLSDTGATLDDYSASLMENGATEVSGGILNGLNAVSYAHEESDLMGIAIETEDGKLISFDFGPASDEEYAAVASIMMTSIQTYDETAEDAAEEEVAEEETAEE